MNKISSVSFPLTYKKPPQFKEKRQTEPKLLDNNVKWNQSFQKQLEIAKFKLSHKGGVDDLG